MTTLTATRPQWLSRRRSPRSVAGLTQQVSSCCAPRTRVAPSSITAWPRPLKPPHHIHRPTFATALIQPAISWSSVRERALRSRSGTARGLCLACSPCSSEEGTTSSTQRQQSQQQHYHSCAGDRKATVLRQAGAGETSLHARWVDRFLRRACTCHSNSFTHAPRMGIYSYIHNRTV